MNTKELKDKGFTKFIDRTNEKPKTIFVKRFKWSNYKLEVDCNESNIKLFFKNPEERDPEQIFECSIDAFDKINEAMQDLESDLKTMYQKANAVFKIIGSKELSELFNTLK